MVLMALGFIFMGVFQMPIPLTGKPIFLQAIMVLMALDFIFMGAVQAPVPLTP
ncbi:TPA: hypothetical protein SD616_001393 [Aeromonas hydrophila]|nr:hypothetical protein [Aeromonas hydrophila]